MKYQIDEEVVFVDRKENISEGRKMKIVDIFSSKLTKRELYETEDDKENVQLCKEETLMNASEYVQWLLDDEEGE